MHEWQQCESRAAALGGDVNGRLGPFMSPGESQAMGGGKRAFAAGCANGNNA